MFQRLKRYRGARKAPKNVVTSSPSVRSTKPRQTNVATRERCLFCEFQAKGIRGSEYENDYCYALWDGYPVTKLHTLIIPKRHVADYFDLTQNEINAIHSLLHKTRIRVLKKDPSITGFNIGINIGSDAGQNIPHCHLHLIPRRANDVDDPSGGIRQMIPSIGDR